MIQVQDFLQRVLSYYHSSFDLTVPCSIGGKEYAALAALHAHEDQYVRVVGTTLWNADSHEYTLFQTFEQAPTGAELEEMLEMAGQYMEPQFVRGGEPLPPKDHQYTWLSLVLLSQHTPDPAVIKRVKSFRKTWFYRFYLRGYCEVRVILADLETGTLTANPAGRSLKKLYALALKNAREASSH